MSIESEVFKKSTADFERLEKFGFKREGGGYTYSEPIMDGDFRAEVFVGDDGAVTGKVFDCASGEEYLPVHTMLHTGPFVGEVREAYTAVLSRITDECFIKEPFIYEQSNRIAQLIFERYGERPDYPFKIAQDYGVFRYPDNRKWYAVVMAIERSKLDKDGKSGDSGTVEIANIKIDTEMRDALLRTPGIIPAYHMNHKSWVSIILDGSLSNERVMELIDISRQFAMSAGKPRKSNDITTWIIPANPKYYDVDAAFSESREIIWKQGKGIKKGDIVYMYVGAPTSAVRYKCLVTETDIPYDYSDKNVKIRYIMKIKRLKTYPPDKFTFKWLGSIGIKTVRGPRGTTEEFLKAVEKTK